jgi:D-alanine-D-alanine ligase
MVEIMNEFGTKLKVAVIFGGRSGEHEVSLESARSLFSTLNKDKYDVIPVGISHDGVWYSGDDVLEKIAAGNLDGLMEVTILPDSMKAGLYQISDGRIELITKLDVVFPIIHGTYGEDGSLQGLLEMAELAYVGGGVLGSAVGMDKGVFKDVMKANDIPVVDSLLFNRKEFENDQSNIVDQITRKFEFPVFVKPANMGSSVGITKCNNPSDLLEGLKEASRFDRRILVERGINAREIEISVLGNDLPIASVPGEVLPSRDFYSYESKYVDGSSGLLIPAPLPEDMKDELKEIAIKAYKAIDCAGMARVDFFMDKDSGKYYLNELNTLPGFTKISMYPKLWQASGIDYGHLVDKLINLALERKADHDLNERNFRSSK